MGSDEPFVEDLGDTSRSATLRTPTARRPPLAVDDALRSVRAHLLAIQEPDGHWCAELEGGSILQSEYALLMFYIGRQADPKVVKTAEYLRRTQLPNGGWPIYPGGPTEVSASVEAYFVLKMLGDDPESEPMRRARAAILDGGGLSACNSFTKLYLAIFGQIEWSRCPAVPPEMVLLPSGSPLNIYKMSSWSRTIFVPLSIIWATKPHREVPPHLGIGELDAGTPTPEVQRWNERLWRMIFTGTDLALKGIERLPKKPLRQRALKRAEAWILERLVNSDGLGAIFPPIINTIIALDCLGYSHDSPLFEGQLAELERLQIEEAETLRLQPCFSAVWDTGQTVNALADGGELEGDSRLLRAAAWLLDREVRAVGDWKHQVAADVEPGGWCFEYANPWYPDCDDTTMVVTALSKLRIDDPELNRRWQEASERAVRWLLAMQNSDGGWASFDRNCNLEILTHVPFADHNAMIDPSNEDITGRVLETLRAVGVPPHHPAVRRGVAYLSEAQLPDGSWYGRWGVNYVYGTWLSAWGLRCSEVRPTDSRLTRAAAWLRSVQRPDGAWGESPYSYDDPKTKGQGEATAAQTAWAVLGLVACGEERSDAVRRGVDWLLGTQRPDGSWYDEAWTGTGFPTVFYLRYHLYAVYFPLLALSVYDKAIRGLCPGPWRNDEGDFS